jgi:23S rRNA (adenine2503-C2)-methyltransferase
MRARPQLKDHSLDRLRERLARDGLAPYRAEQIAGWLYGRGVEDPAQMTDLSLELRSWLSAQWELRALEVERVERSADGSIKAVLRTRDALSIESVLIPERDRTTLCVSTQVGCPMACSFCATGYMGFSRNLSTAEIVDQVCRMRELLVEGQSITNVVFMGMGEPLLNFAAVVEALRLLVDPKAFGMAPSRVTVSTVGIAPRMADLLACVPVNLAVSLHATTDEVRDRLVPVNRRFPLQTLLGALRGIDAISRRRPVFFEYALIAGLNDSLEDARRLHALLRGIPSKVNVIPLNPHPESSLVPPEEFAVDRFVGEVARRGLTVTLRRSRGADIHAACGQLALRAPSASAA